MLIRTLMLGQHASCATTVVIDCRTVSNHSCTTRRCQDRSAREAATLWWTSRLVHACPAAQHTLYEPVVCDSNRRASNSPGRAWCGTTPRYLAWNLQDSIMHHRLSTSHAACSLKDYMAARLHLALKPLGLQHLKKPFLIMCQVMLKRKGKF